MSTTTPEPNAVVAPDAPASAVPAPVAAAETEVAEKAPQAVKPAVESVEDQFNTVFNDAVKGAPAEEAKAETAEPAVGTFVKDIESYFRKSGKPVSIVNVAGDAKAAEAAVKAGYKTTEFWGSAAVIVLTQVGLINVPGKYGETITTAATAVAYVLSRGLAKLGAKKS